ncbi:MAG: HesA/MoeB/ThiF family protein [Nitrososphaerota archaeon]|nr:HesA/MoeB/ThiF family protein [Aigarchaeota archaeon]MDW8076537.1 HesA/MoeB/ThiF family protein [Nitrososphaerota archaeon]
MKLEELTDKELERYSRQLVLNYIGYAGQTKLRSSRVCIMGAGGLGSPAAITLAAMGVGYIRIVDRDVVSLSDLHRQRFYGEDFVGMPKVEVLEERINSLNPGVKVDAVAANISSKNVESLLEGIDLVIDGLDSVEARYIINRAIVKLKIPYIFAAAIETVGVVSTILPNETACLECFYSGLQDEDLPKCATVGVFPPLIDMVSGAQLSEAIRVLLNKNPLLKNRLLYIDVDKMSFDFVNIAKLPDCPVCGSGKVALRPLKEKVVSGVCGRDGRGVFMVTTTSKIDLDSVERLLSQHSILPKKRTKLGITFEYKKDITITFLKDGVTVVQVAPGSGIYDVETVLELYEELVEKFAIPPVKD